MYTKRHLTLLAKQLIIHYGKKQKLILLIDNTWNSLRSLFTLSLYGYSKFTVWWVFSQWNQNCYQKGVALSVKKFISLESRQGHFWYLELYLRTKRARNNKRSELRTCKHLYREEDTNNILIFSQSGVRKDRSILIHVDHLLNVSLQQDKQY